MTTKSISPRSSLQLSCLSDQNEPIYELRLIMSSSTDWRFELWQLPNTVTPRLALPESLGMLSGTPLNIVQQHLLKRLVAHRISIDLAHSAVNRKWRVTEDLALHLGLLFRILAPMKNIDNIRIVAAGIDQMSREEVGYWLGMAMHRDQPRRVLSALRTLLGAE